MKSREELRETIPGEQSVKIRRVKRGRDRETKQRAEMKKFKKLRDCGSEEDHEEHTDTDVAQAIEITGYSVSPERRCVWSTGGAAAGMSAMFTTLRSCELTRGGQAAARMKTVSPLQRAALLFQQHT